MTARRIWLCVIAVLVLPLSCPGAYLPAIGPAPLRFIAEPQSVSPPEAVSVQPASQTNVPTVVTNMAAETSAADTNPPAPLLPPVVMTAESPPPIDWLIPFGDSTWENVDTNLVTPQSMLQFFQESQAGRKRTAVWGPVVFTPPVPANRQQSKSAYSTP